jgi:hypothetical protein
MALWKVLVIVPWQAWCHGRLTVEKAPLPSSMYLPSGVVQNWIWS